MTQKTMKIIETKHYLSQMVSICHKSMDKDNTRTEIIQLLCSNPTAGDVIPRTGGLRKIRYAVPGKGKRGGLRIIYYFYDASNPMYLLHIYAKSTTENLSPKEEKSLTKIAQQLKATMKG